jgi:hypothetical protein
MPERRFPPPWSVEEFQQPVRCSATSQYEDESLDCQNTQLPSTPWRTVAFAT